MADNPTIKSGEAGDDIVVATDDDGSAHHQYVKLEWGADNTQTKVAAGASALPIQDGGNTITVDGTVAVTQSGTWDEVGINDSGNSITVDDGGTTLSVDDGGSSLSIDDGGNTITVDGTVSITGVSAVADVIDLTNSDAVAVAIVDGSGDQITSFGGGTQYTEADTDSSITGTAVMWEDTSDTLRAVSASKPLPVGDAGGSLTVDNGGTFAVQVDGSALTALQLIDDAVYVDDADWADNTSKHLNVGGVYQSSPHTVTDGDVTPFLTDVNGRQVVTGTLAVTQSGTWDEVGINDSGNSITVDDGGSSLSIDDGGNTITVDGTVSITGVSAVADVIDLTNSDAVAVAIVDGSGDQITSFGGGTQYTEADTDASITGTAILWEDTSDTLRAVSAAKPLPVSDAGGTLSIDDGGGIITVDGTVAVTGVATDAKLDTIIGHVDGLEALIGTTNTNTGNTATSLGVMDDWDNAASDGASVSGDVAAAATDAGEPVKIGGRADTTIPTAVTDGQRVNAWFNEYGAIYVREQGAPVVATGQVAPTNSAATLLAARTSRTEVTFLNYGGVTVYIGPATVTTANGFALDPGASITLKMTALIEAITAAGTGAIHYIETYA